MNNLVAGSKNSPPLTEMEETSRTQLKSSVQTSTAAELQRTSTEPVSRAGDHGVIENMLRSTHVDHSGQHSAQIQHEIGHFQRCTARNHDPEKNKQLH